MPVFRTFEATDFEDYIAYLREANRENPDFVPVDDRDAMARVLLKAPAYRRNGHFLALEAEQIVADAVAMERPGSLGFIQWNALPEYRDAETFDGLLARCLTYLRGKASEIRVLLRPEHVAAREPIRERGFVRVAVLARFANPGSRMRSARPVRAMRPEDTEGVAAVLARVFEDEPLFSLAPLEGSFGMVIRREPASSAYFVAERDDQPVGVAGVGARGRDGIVDFLAVDRDYRRAGVGTSLLSTALFWTSQRGCAQAFAVADPANEVATEFYHRLGFAPTEPEWRVVYGGSTQAEPTDASVVAALGRV